MSFENLKLYINPYTLKIEPVVSDQSVINKYGIQKIKNFSSKEPNKFIILLYTKLFKNNFKKYLTELENNLSYIYDEEKICSYFVLDCPKIKNFTTNLRKIKIIVMKNYLKILKFIKRKIKNSKKKLILIN